MTMIIFDSKAANRHMSTSFRYNQGNRDHETVNFYLEFDYYFSSCAIDKKF